jgi:hypothetical protein
LEDVPAVDKAGDNNLSASGVCLEYDALPVEYTNTFCNVTPVAQTDQRANPSGCPIVVDLQSGNIIAYLLDHGDQICSLMTDH